MRMVMRLSARRTAILRSMPNGRIRVKSGFHSFLNHREAIRRASLIARTSPIETDHRSWYGSKQAPSVGAHNQNEVSDMTADQSQDLTGGASVTATPSSNTSSTESHSHRDKGGDARAPTG